MTKPRVFVTCQLIGKAVERLQQTFDVQYRNNPVPATPAELLEHSADADALVSQLDDVIDAAFLQKCPRLKVVANVAVGYNNIDVGEATKRGILVLNTPGVLTNATADLTFGLLLSVARRITESDRYVRAGKWGGWSSDFMLGQELSGKTLGIVGMGRIGEAVAKRAVAFGMKIKYTRRGPIDDGRPNDGSINAPPVKSGKDARLRTEYSAARLSLDELLREADFISLHCPLNNDTKHLIGRIQFGRMKHTSVLINTARGAVIDQSALISALQSGQIAGAGFDVFENEPSVPKELINMENVVLTPHIGSATTEARTAMSDLACDGTISAFSEKLPANVVNPEVWDKLAAALKA